MAVTFSSPVYVKDEVKKLVYCTLTVAGNGKHTVAKGVGDTEFQARRNAVATYKKEHKLAFMDIPT